ncbi:CoA transferase [Brevibacterium sp. 91QC2O2]|uniref:CaiB/BaiF CoA transferase family protein n=1 Tax=Brevibacterium TaxID=1696 RepID=UPI00211BC9DC|nr:MULTISPECIES: CaiB/BaiF CoA-transferase family protein [unclassified Brevibacterium]MCQ9369403.1 CoA transferase [Brevibacterium sp. 91QC2O2]MCQ9386932.1 CoA transferase [Brevibacterium sp. 68QC2CO]
MTGPLSGVKVVDMSRLAPGPVATQLLADLGAEVVSIGGGRAGTPIEEASRGKTFISLNLKDGNGRAALDRLVSTADVFVESFRPGVAERLGAGYPRLSALNPALVYCSITGYGQEGPMAQAAGHDINYLAQTGVLAMLGPTEGFPTVPLNLVADFAGGSLVAAFRICAALVDRDDTGKGQYLDVAMVDGVRALMPMNYATWKTSAAPERGRSVIGGEAPFYRCYETADDRLVAVGALEPQFFARLWNTLGLGEVPAQYPRSQWPAIEEALAVKFKTRSRDDWAAEFATVDACVSPVLTPDELDADPQLAARHGTGWGIEGPPIDIATRDIRRGRTDRTDRTVPVLRGLGLSETQIAKAHDLSEPAGLTKWPEM